MIEIQMLATGSKGNSYYITDGETPLLLECGISFREIQRKLHFKASSIAGCLVTHEHNDHCAGIKEVMKAGINCYMSPGTKQALDIQHHRLKAIEKQPFRLGTWTILPFEAQHDVSEPYCFLLANKAGDKLLFATDTYYIKHRFNGLTHIMVECNFSKAIIDQKVAEGRLPKGRARRLQRSHFSLERVKEFLVANDLSKVEEIWLLHLSDSNSNEEQFKREIAELTGKIVYVP